MFEQMLALQDLFSVNLGDFPMDDGRSLFRHQVRIDSQFRRSVHAYHSLLLFFKNGEKLLALAQTYVNETLGARTVFRKEYGKTKQTILDEIEAYQSTDRERYRQAVAVADIATKAFYQRLDPHSTGMRNAFQGYLTEANRAFAQSGATLFPGGSA